jgi:hypothetical protein
MRREPMTPRQAALIIGKPDTDASGAWMRRYIRRREERTGKTIATRLSYQGGERLMVTESSLRRHCPELFPVQGEAEILVRAMKAEIDKKLQELNDRIANLEWRTNLSGARS